MSQLVSSSYGKSNVKFLKVRKDASDPKVQEVLEANVEVLLRGGFDDSYTKADNSSIVPTDTVKNTILVEAKNTNVWPIERFAGHLAQHFTKKYSHVEGIEIKIIQSKWTKYEVQGKLHAHSFKHEGPETKRTYLNYDKKTDNLVLTSSIKDLTVLKSTGSMFYGFHECDYTILKPTTDRILSTDVDGSWTFDSKKIGGLAGIAAAADRGLFDSTYELARKTTLELFALENSPSVQATMYNMSHAILDAEPAVKTVTYVLPNKHFILFNLEWKGIKGNDDLYYPSPDPNGLIKCTVGRNSSKL
ncbi:uricase [[Candida] anglica]|uniref:Uricase n=1 Tax=[Candida] anglica TaxID=148631 RepID=A0ABP0EEF9_9ASCO